MWSSTGVKVFRILLAPLLFLGMMDRAVAGDADNLGAASAVARGNTAILFQLAEDFDLEPFSGLTISIKHMYSDSRAYRFSLSVSARETDKPRSNDAISTDLTLQRLHQMVADRSVTPFVAFGPMLGYTGARDSIEWRAGLVLAAGAEWFATKHLSFTGEFATSLVYQSADIKVETYDPYDEHADVTPPHRSKAFVIAPNAVKLGIALYW